LTVTFSYWPDAETPDVPSAASFEVGADQMARSITLGNLTAAGFETFPRAAN